MAVKLLAGPFPFTTPKFPGEYGKFMLQAWWPERGLITTGFFYTGTHSDSHQLSCTTLDGVTEGFGGYYYMSPMSWWPARKRMVALYAGKEYQIEPKAGITQWMGPVDEIDNSESVSFLTNCKYVKLEDRRLAARYSKLWACYPGQPPIEEGPDLPFNGSIGPGRRPHEMAIVGGGGLVFYDTGRHIFSSRHYQFGMSGFSEVVYASDHGVIISCNAETFNGVGSTDVIRIWSLEVEPTTFDPITVFEGTLKSGQIVTFRVRLRGTAVGFLPPPDPAEGELIDWSLTGDGNLLDVQSKTDEDGYAYARVQYWVGETGTTILTASVTC